MCWEKINVSLALNNALKPAFQCKTLGPAGDREWFGSSLTQRRRETFPQEGSPVHLGVNPHPPSTQLSAPTVVMVILDPLLGHGDAVQVAPELSHGPAERRPRGALLQGLMSHLQLWRGRANDLTGVIELTFVVK